MYQNMYKQRFSKNYYIIKISHHMFKSQQILATLSTGKCDLGETGLHGGVDALHSCQFSSLSSIQEDVAGQSQVEKYVSHSKQNKDGANAARTARITLMAMILHQNQKQIMNTLKNIKESLQIKKLMLNIGEKKFKERFLFKVQFKGFFDAVFNNISQENIAQFMRKNKRSQMSYKSRLHLCHKYILRYKKNFLEHFTKKQSNNSSNAQTHQQSQNSQILFPIPISPCEYETYMKSKGFLY